MSLLINDMEMPKNCLECMFRISYWKRTLTPSGEIFTYGCMLNRKEINILEKRCKDCPIVEIPTPHGRLIDADKLVKVLQDTLDNYPDNYNEGKIVEKLVVKTCKQFIEHCPTIIEAEVSE